MIDQSSEASSENLYQTILKLQFPKHPLSSGIGLKDASRILSEAMHERRIAVREQGFVLHDGGDTFWNIVGSCGPVGTDPAWVIIAHYDTVDGSPGANDNASGISVMLETARLLAAMDNPPPVYFVAATLEESSSPLYAGREAVSARNHGLVDKNGRFMTWEYARQKKHIQKRAMQFFLAGGNQGNGYRMILKEDGNSLHPSMRNHLEDLAEIYADIDPDSAIGRRSRIGSTRWVEDTLKHGIPLAGCIALDEIGIYSDQPGSQPPNAQIDFNKFTSGYRLQEYERVANFLLILSNNDSKELGDRFEEQCRKPEIEMPYARAHLPFSYKQIVQNLPKALSSDHAPFWKYGIPALFLFDTSTPRDFWNHTPADTLDKLDFKRMKVVANALYLFLSS